MPYRRNCWKNPTYEAPSEKLKNTHYLIRRVKWVGKVDERELDYRVQSNLRTRNPLVVLPTRSFEKSLNAAHPNMKIEDQFYVRFLTKRDTFSAFDNLYFHTFIMAVASIYQRLKDGRSPLVDENESIYDIAASLPRDSEFVPVEMLNIQSQGHSTLKSSTKVCIISAMLFSHALAVNAGETDFEHYPDIGVTNSESSTFDPCEAGIDKEFIEILDGIGFVSVKLH